jgi:hypothetical protein
LRSLDERLLQLGSRTQALHADMANLRVADIAAARSRDTEYLRISTEEFNVGCWRASRSRMKVEGNERDVRPFALRSRRRPESAPRGSAAGFVCNMTPPSSPNLFQWSAKLLDANCFSSECAHANGVHRRAVLILFSWTIRAVMAPCPRIATFVDLVSPLGVASGQTITQ